jgi:hypothetical protein
VASVRLKCSRSPSGIAVKSTVESTCPIFIGRAAHAAELLDQLTGERGCALAAGHLGALR